MATKWKNISYSTGAKAVTAVIAWLSLMGIFICGGFLAKNNTIINDRSYFDSYQFQDGFGRLVHNVVELNVQLKSIENIKATTNPQNVAEKVSRLARINERLASTVNFIYYIKNAQTNEIITNVKSGDAVTLIRKQQNAVLCDQTSLSGGYFNYQEEVQQMLAGTPYEVYAAVIQPPKQGDSFYDEYTAFSQTKAQVKYVFLALIASVGLFVVAFAYLIYVTGRREKGGGVVLAFIDKLYVDVFSLLVLIAAGMSIDIAAGVGWEIETIIVVSIIWGIDALIGLTYVLSMVRQAKNGQILRNTLTFRVVKGITAFAQMCFSGRLFKGWILLLLVAYGAVNAILFAIVMGVRYDFWAFFFTGLLLVTFNAAVVYFTAKALFSLTQIMGAVKEISAGNLEYALDRSQISVAFAGFAENIQSIQGGLKKAVAEAVKGERMKTELITNVSHDLKTPLTSIVNYVDLLKQENLQNEKADEYVGILEEKSARLKQLIEDLVEASKAVSGNLAVKAEKVDLHELVMQACGEYEEKIRQAALDIRINAAEKQTMVWAEGKYMWRIVENLLSNALKYAMPGSRVYINLEKTDQYGVLIIKNVSASPLDIPAAQLTERFVRGDSARTTEGSGLGLSIAQGLTTIQGGRFKIDIDGDLFKVIVEIPLWTKEI